jgi:hypothetical protein
METDEITASVLAGVAGKRPEFSRIVSVGRFHMNDLSPEICQKHCRYRRRQDVAQINNSDTF